ncbi:YcaO-like family protein [Sulfitobacter geojensis]|uniref:YcaO-like family protein n=1 Tax=Sulfitobacter geojensis TaxID=1342299 RepID=A0AAE2W2G6_9RHOB|nr:YcaO-like family protein [Sulfitobacter geojensis]MBM1691604.1 YcaO-like family protein [Sulfitobacter geojensis]MBM1695670.1 YcaO-like family protein [Sulfitobacter geojensis]MBM1707835.1 YcaO-like family protein [Sulfitobacter geojensis]MBM1711894.1 YcaO-like family protein [Sulfitobacter geojensis]MBM1715959.1 YcaO-like family protein [Sulfitobacter geojensis]
MKNDADLGFLISAWDRSDRRKSLFAPGVDIFQALTTSGATASGLGDTRNASTSRCISETAEILAKEAAQLTGAAFTNFGFAAHSDTASAKHAAHLEAHERVQIWQWWQGQRHAKRIPAEWLQTHGFDTWLSTHRATASIKRQTGLWLLTPASGVLTVICKSKSQMDEDIILGFGAATCVFEAVSKALRENLLMELNLVEVMATRGGFTKGDTSWIERKIAQYAARCPAILRQEEASMPATPKKSFETQLAALETTPTSTLQELPMPCPSRSVWKCTLTETRQLPPSGPSSPFMSRST